MSFVLFTALSIATVEETSFVFAGDAMFLLVISRRSYTIAVAVHCILYVLAASYVSVSQLMY